MAIETTAEEETEMPRTSSKTTATAETLDFNVVLLRPDQEEQPPVEEQAQAPEPDEPSDGEEQPERQSRGGRGPALNRVELIDRIAKGPGRSDDAQRDATRPLAGRDQRPEGAGHRVRPVHGPRQDGSHICTPHPANSRQQGDQDRL